MSNAIEEKAEAYRYEHSSQNTSSLPSTVSVEERALVRKLDFRLMPLFFLIYLITFIDRANVGNAKVAGLATDLKLVGYQYNISLTVFYIFYALWEMPSNLVCKKLGPKIWIPLQVTAFGVVCMSTAFIRNFGEFVVVRVLLGIAEGGVLPAMSLVLSRFYRRAELVFRIAIMVSAASLAGAFGGLLASGFIAAPAIKHVGKSWRNIFLYEGIITIVIGILIYFIMPTQPAEASFLSTEERELAISRLNTRATNSQPLVEETKAALVKQGFLSPTTWLCAFGYMATNVSVQGISLFLPTIIQGLYPGLPTVQIQLRTVPPFVVAFVWSLFLAYVADRLNRRAFVMMASSPFVITGYIIFIATGKHDIHARYAGAFLCILGAFPLGPFFLAWATNNSATDTERGIAGGLVPGFGQFGALMATWCYLPKDAPNYYQGNKINVGFASLCLCITVTMYFYCSWENKVRARGGRDYRLDGLSAEDDHTNTLGSKHPAFIYSV